MTFLVKSYQGRRIVIERFTNQFTALERVRELHAQRIHAFAVYASR